MKTKLLLFIVFLVFYHTYAQQTYVPDDAFEQRLIELGLDLEMDDYVTTSNISAVTSLSLSQAGISNLTGIEDFTALEELYVYLNQLTTLDLSQNTNLKFLECWDNQLSSINITQNVLLEELYISNNQLTSLDVSQNTALIKLLCGRNNLTTLDVTQNINLKILNCGENQLTALNITQNVLLESLRCSINQVNSFDVSQCILLETLMVYSNKLTNLDLTQNNNLEVVWIHNNQLAQVDIRNGNNTEINGFRATNNPNLTCIFVEDANYSANNPGWEKDPTSTYVETQAECDALSGINDPFLQRIKIYPNPVSKELHISLPDKHFEKLFFRITDITGKKLYTYKSKISNFKIDLSHLSSGIYFLNIYRNKTRLLTKKLIKL